ncbi:hypothetical protein A4A49_15630 [Nicotiana attenuata]|uniref:Uncharacterized protein n=1 Tax=Nicotiana attenuata TaxID=49451 RepID=A0A314L406_NICAT|nr:hypothetical protein A4A49_15630 [Nicotiana attenuata]
MNFDGLYDSIGGANFGIVKEFYANRVPGFQYDGEYTIKIRGNGVKFSAEIINDELGFRNESHVQFEEFMKRLAYQAIYEFLCGPNSLASWNRDRMEDMMQFMFADMQLRAARREVDIEALAQQSHLGAPVRRFLGLDDSPALRPDEDVNSVAEDDDETAIPSTTDGADD